MNQLVPVESFAVFNSIILLLLIGVTFFVFFILAMIFLFGISTKNTLKNAKGLVVLLILCLSIPLGLSLVQKKTVFFSKASQKIEISNLEKVPVNATETLVTFTTSKPVIVYMEYLNNEKNEIPVLPTYTLEKRTDHAFLVTNTQNKENNLYIVANGTRYLIKKE